MARVSGGQRITLAKYSTTERDALTPSAGMCIYNTTTNEIEVYNGGAWTGGEDFIPADAAVQSQVTSNDTDITNLNNQLGALTGDVINNTTITNQVQPLKVIVTEYDASQGTNGDIGAHAVLTLPADSVVTKFQLITKVEFTTASGTANLEIRNGPRFPVANSPHTGAPWTRGGNNALGYTGTTFANVPFYAGLAESNIVLTVANNNVTAGTFVVYIEYFTMPQ
tara:strand:+ start:13607 stop:14278 length:672 start_codon:yes stop_codon:yes gene_type:complete